MTEENGNLDSENRPVTSPVDSPRPKILIVDDKEQNLLTLEKVLAETDAETVKATNGNDALKATLNHEFALAILDVQMPGMDGYELAEFLRAEEKTASLPIMFLSAAYSDELHVFKGYEAGAVDFIAKPFNPAILRSKVRVFLELHRQRAELAQKIALERSRNYLESILASMSDAVIVVSPEGAVEMVNKVCASLFERQEAELIGRPVAEILRDGEYASPGVESGPEETRHEESELSGADEERTLTVGSGRRVPVLISGATLRGTPGRSGGAVITLKDITQRKKAEEALRDSEAKYLDLYENAPDMYVSVDAATGTMSQCNQTLAEKTGYTKDEILGRPVLEIYHPDSLEGAKGAFQEFIRTGQVRNAELQLQRKDGGVIDVMLNVSAVRDEQGNILHSRSSWRDVTALKQAQGALRAKTEEVELMSQQLWQSSKLATMGELAASIAHELNNPLATVSLLNESLLMKLGADDAGTPSPEAKSLATMEQEIERMAALVSSLLEFSRRGKRQISTMDVCEEIERSLELIHYHLRKRSITVEKDFATDLPMVHADRQQLRQVFINLATNAADAMPEGGTLTIRVRREGDQRPETRDQRPASRILIEFADTGAGIPAEDIPRLFEPFFTTKPEGQGTGLGLPICKRIIDEHHGELTIESEVDKGTTVRMELPVQNGSNGHYLEIDD